MWINKSSFGALPPPQPPNWLIYKTQLIFYNNGRATETDHDRPVNRPQTASSPKSLSLIAFRDIIAPHLRRSFSWFVLWVGQIHRVLSTLSLALLQKSKERERGKREAEAAKPWLNQTEPTNPASDQSKTCTSQTLNFLVRYLILI